MIPVARAVRASIAALLACALLSACSAAGPAASVRAPEATPSVPASVTASAPAGAEPSASALSSDARTATATAETTRVAGTAPAEALPLPDPIATIPAPTAAKAISGPRNLGVPQLMYHVIGTAPKGAELPDLYVAPTEFVAQLTYLSSHGYHAVTLQQVYDFWNGHGTLPSKPIVLSFDDGDTPDFEIAAPLMNEVRWPGVLNLIVGRHQPRLKPGIIRALIAAGWEIDSHTISHSRLPEISPARWRTEIAGSRTALRKLYGVPVNFFCYPGGKFNAAIVAEVKAAGYLGATTTLGGLSRPADAFTMRRVRVSGGMGASGLAEMLADYR